MQLSAPKTVTFIIGVALGVIAVVLALIPSLGVDCQIIILIAVLGVVVLALGNLVKGL